MALTAEQEMQRNALAQQLMSGQGDPNTRNAVLNEWARLEGMRRDPYGFDPYGSSGSTGGQGPNTSATGPSPTENSLSSFPGTFPSDPNSLTASTQPAGGPALQGGGPPSTAYGDPQGQSEPAPEIDSPPRGGAKEGEQEVEQGPIATVEIGELTATPQAQGTNPAQTAPAVEAAPQDPGKGIEDDPAQTQTSVFGTAKGEAGVQAPAPQQEEITDPEQLNSLDFQSMLDNPGQYGVSFNGIGGLPGFGATGLPAGVGTQGVQGVQGMAPTEGVPYASMFGDPQGMTVGAQGNPGAFGVGGFAGRGGMAPTEAVPYTGVEYEDMPGMGLPGAAPEISGMSPTSYGVQQGEFGENPLGELGDPMGYDDMVDGLDGLDGAPGGDPGGMDDMDGLDGQDGAPGGDPGGMDDVDGLDGQDGAPGGDAPGGGDPGGQDEDGQDGPSGSDDDGDDDDGDDDE